MAAPDSGKLCCLRCGKPVDREASAPEEATRADQRDDAPPKAGPSASGYDGWDLDETLRHTGRLLGASPRPATQSKKAKTYRIDAAHAGFTGHRGAHREPETAREHDLGSAVLGGIAWITLTLGLMASACGGVLLIWSAVVRRDDLWSVGLPIAIAGLLALAIAMVMQIDRLLGDNRRTAAKIERFNSRLTQLRRDAAMSATDSPPAGSAFYNHMAEGASPGLLLSDLKSQLELLTQRLDGHDDESSDLM